MPRRLLPALIAAVLAFMASTARAGDNFDAQLALAGIALIDVAALPADVVMAATRTRVPRDYAEIEAVAGGLQAIAGGILLGFCATDRDCRSSAPLPVILAFTAWTTAMTIHGVVSSVQSRRGRASIAPQGPSLALVPIVGDTRTTPAGLGLVGVF